MDTVRTVAAAARRTLTTVAILAAVGTAVAGCATSVSGQGSPDPAAAAPATTTTTTASPTATSSAAAPSPATTPSLDPATNRRVTCALMMPLVADAMTKWNDLAAKKGGTAASVAASFEVNSSTIKQLAAQLPADDPVRATATQLATQMGAMAVQLRAGKNPATDQFNALVEQLQQRCAS